MVDVPAAMPVTTPPALIVATAVLDDDQVPPAVASAKVVVRPTQTLIEPVMAATTGSGFTVTVSLIVAVQPNALVTVTV